MALSGRGTSARQRPASSEDDLEGDIMRFSDLDFVRLGLAIDANPGTTSKQHQGLANNGHHFPEGFHCVEYTPEVSSNRQLFAGQLPDYAGSIIPSTNASWPVIDPNLDGDRLWQPTAISSQTSIAQVHDFEHKSLDGDRTMGIWAPTSPSTGVFPFAAMPENREPGLPRRRSRYFRGQRHNPTPLAPIDIPSSTMVDDALGPLERWRDSPPETEPATLSDIANALRQTRLQTHSSAGSLNSQRTGSRARSTSSLGSGTSCSSVSNTSVGSATFHSSSNRSRGRVAKRHRVNKKGKEKDTNKKIFPCTFCCDSFKNKYDWARHEKSLHLNLDEWRCAPFGGVIVFPDTGRAHCMYCDIQDPNANHLESHNHNRCVVDGQRPTFNRKDHLVQHLRLVHHAGTLPTIDSWKVEGPPVSSTCGFCNIRMQSWQERVDHLAHHFRDGAKMDDWKGEHCFESSIAAKVMHAMPPYLIGPESRALIPFSVNSQGTKDHLSQIQRASEQSLEMWDKGQALGLGASSESPTQPESSNTVGKDTNSKTFPEVLALHLGHFAQEQMRLGVIPTDRMFQDEARRIMFDSVDPWDQTIADNSDWLSSFRNRHLKNVPSS